MKKRERKGFTIVELVIVIAIVAVLAAVLIPTFASLIDKANESADLQAAKQLNDALIAGSIPEIPKTLDRVIEILADAGYNSEDCLVPITKGFKFFWYPEYNVIVLAEWPEEFNAIEFSLDTFIDGNTVPARVLYPPETEEASRCFGELLNQMIVVIRNYESANGSLPSYEYLAGLGEGYEMFFINNLENGKGHLNDYVENPEGAGVVDPTGITMQSSLDMSINTTYKLTATVKPSNATNKTITWTTSDSSIVSVDASGTLTAKAYGEATITAKVGAITATCEVTVKEVEVDSVQISHRDLFRIVGQTFDLNVTLNPPTATNQNVSWRSSDDNVATVDQNGNVTAVAPGTATVTVTSANGKSDSCNVVVMSAELETKTLSILVGSQGTITTSVNLPAELMSNVAFSYESSNTNVAPVNDGYVLGMAAGTAEITVRVAYNGLNIWEDKCTVTVNSAVSGVTIVPVDSTIFTVSPSGSYIYTGAQGVLQATVATSNGTAVKVGWENLNSDIASITAVDNNTVTITANRPGTTTITATAQDGSNQKATYTVIVIDRLESLDFTNATGGSDILIIGETKQYVLASNSSVKGLQWGAADNVGAITYDQNGNVTALNVGNAWLTAQVTDHKGNTFNVQLQISVISGISSVTLDKETLDLVIVGDTKSEATLTATVTAANGATSVPGLIWKSSKESVATVDENGKVTAVANGTADITVASADAPDRVLAFCKVTVNTATVTFNTSTIEIVQGGEAALIPTVNPAGTGYTVTSNNEEVAIWENGVVRGVSAGNATITITTADGLTATCTVTVKALVSGVEIQNSNGTAVDSVVFENIGSTQQLSALVTPDSAPNKSVTWNSSNTNVATVDENGVVTAVASGNATITATSVADGTKMDTCTVIVSIKVASISLNKTSVALTKGAAETLTATISPANADNKAVTWDSSDKAVATVDANGQVTAVGGGTAVITVTTADGGKTASCTVTVTVNVSSVNLNKNELTLVVNAEEQLKATVKPDDATNKTVNWTSTNSKVATVDANGNVKAVGVGTATIVALVKTADNNNVIAECAVTVTPIVVSGADGLTTALPTGSNGKVEPGNYELSFTENVEPTTAVTYTIGTGANVVIDLNDNSINQNVKFVVDGGTLTIKNGTYLNSSYSVIEIKSTDGIVELNNVEIKSAKDAGATITNDGGEMTLNGCIFQYTTSYPTYEINNLNGGTMVIDGGAINNAIMGTVNINNNASTLELNGVNMTAGTININAKAGSYTEINGGVYNGQLMGSKVNVESGATMKFDEAVLQRGSVSGDGVITGKVTVSSENRYYISGEYTYTFSADSTTSNDLKYTFSTGSNVDIDLNGKTLIITSPFTVPKGVTMNIRNGQLNITGSGFVENLGEFNLSDVTLRYEFEGSNSSSRALLNSGTLRIEDCQFIFGEEDDFGFNLKSGSASFVNVTITANTFSYTVSADCNVTYSNCVFSFTDDIYFSGYTGDLGEGYSYSTLDIDYFNVIVNGVPKGFIAIEDASGDVVLTEYTGTATDIVIPADVEKIADDVFKNNTTITSVTIGNKVTSIGNNAFRNCTSLRNVYIGKNVTYIGTNILTGCKQFNKITIPYIGRDTQIPALGYLFGAEATGENGNEWFGSNASVSMSNVIINELEILEGITKIDKSAFKACGGIKNVIIPDSVTLIDNYAFDFCANLNLPDLSGITTIGQCAFRGCNAFREVTIPSSVTTIGVEAFDACVNLTKIYIPDSVTSLGARIFMRCRSLKEVRIPFVGQTKTSGDLKSMFGTDAILANASSYVQPTNFTVTVSKASTVNSNAFSGCVVSEQTTDADGNTKVTVTKVTT